MKKNVLIIGHGSRENSANREFLRLVNRYRARHPQWNIRHAFLESAQPGIAQALESMAEKSKTIDVLPLFLFTAGHMKRDIPKILQDFKGTHPGVRINTAKALGPDPLMAQLARERIGPLKTKPSQTVLLVVGRGAGDPQAQKDFKKVARLIAKGMGFQSVRPCFFDAAQPRVELAIENAMRLKPKGILLLPYLLFAGKLALRLKALASGFSRKHPAIKVIVGSTLGAHPRLFRVMDQRLSAKP